MLLHWTPEIGLITKVQTSKISPLLFSRSLFVTVVDDSDLEPSGWAVNARSPPVGRRGPGPALKNSIGMAAITAPSVLLEHPLWVLTR